MASGGNGSNANKKRKLHPARNVWTTTPSSVLIDCWEDRLDDLRGQKRNAGVYADITEALRKLGIKRTVAEVRYKIKNLSKMYSAHQPKKKKESCLETAPIVSYLEPRHTLPQWETLVVSLEKGM
ncbi:hypothetical protein HPB48_016582 [Haemaphysalis longicornis]|uniref:Myb/SANT-like DNA-binding domain-containing protein n=1 Tax=Haemaphysalis longicornis TaxID=44386 RepID=A0A9J6GGT5_HAELO|nr:hypothetical protein HPB48_016582 [Haemaphysalis longicornis]